MPLEFVKSQKGKDQLEFKGYLYTRDRIHGEKTYWKCTEFNTHKCLGRIHTIEEEVVKEVGKHNHEKRNAEIATKRVLAEIKEKAETEPETPQQILASVSAGMSAAVAAKLPKVSLLKRTIQRKRQQASGA